MLKHCFLTGASLWLMPVDEEMLVHRSILPPRLLLVDELWSTWLEINNSYIRFNLIPVLSFFCIICFTNVTTGKISAVRGSFILYLKKRVIVFVQCFCFVQTDWPTSLTDDRDIFVWHDVLLLAAFIVHPSIISGLKLTVRGESKLRVSKLIFILLGVRFAL